MKDKMVAGYAASCRGSAVEKEDKKHHNEESNNDEKAVTVTRSAMATDRAAEGEAGDAKV